jgi:hypothetical protein
MRFSSIDERKQWVGLTMDQDSTAKNTRMQRPMSPHLTIYRFPMPAILSISHRITGVALTGAICAAGIGLIFEPLSFYVDAIQVCDVVWRGGRRGVACRHGSRHRHRHRRPCFSSHLFSPFALLPFATTLHC